MWSTAQRTSRVNPLIPLERCEQDRSDVAVQLKLRVVTHRPLEFHQLQYPHLLLIQACFCRPPALPSLHQSSIHSRHETVLSPQPQTRPSRPILPISTKHLATTATPLRHMADILPTIFLLGKPVVTSWARCRSKDFSSCFFRSVMVPQSVRNRKELPRAYRTHKKRLICILHL
jgi:hypothetical protein